MVDLSRIDYLHMSPNMLERVDKVVDRLVENSMDYLFDKFPLRILEECWRGFDERVLCPLERYLGR
ncbi:hypothetical protein CL618_01455 [archaeon]|mgnify:CR=1 FL=1|nr:hypothetical protein [archaeon]|tara:strand:+ start:1664 stop:1861 length:198 start_codon:yes stop_codon:yes gene_type:complete